MKFFKKLIIIYRYPGNWGYTFLFFPLAYVFAILLLIGNSALSRFSPHIFDYFCPSQAIDDHLTERNYKLLGFKSVHFSSGGVYYWHLQFSENVAPIPADTVTYDYSPASKTTVLEERNAFNSVWYLRSVFADSCGIPEQGKVYYAGENNKYHFISYVPSERPGELYIRMKFK